MNSNRHGMINISCKYSLPEEIKYSKHEACKLHNYILEIYVVYLQELLLKSPKFFSPAEFGRLYPKNKSNSKFAKMSGRFY